MPAEHVLRRLLNRLRRRRSSSERGHGHHSGHESQEAPLGRRARAREADPRHQHHEDGGKQ